MENRKSVSKELIKTAKEQDVFDILSRDGVPMTYVNGIYRHRKHDSLVVTPGKGFYWFSRGEGSRSPIDYYMKAENMGFVEAVYKVLDVMNYDYSRKNVVISTPKHVNTNYIAHEFSLPPKAEDNKRVFAYLTKTRGIEADIVNIFLENGSIYQDAKYSNAVFIGKDYEGNIVSAFKRSTKTNLSKNAFKSGDQEGSQKEYRFRIENMANKTLNIFESEIDMLSYICLQHPLLRNENYIAMGGLSEKAACTFLKHNEIEHINICTDNDDKGWEFVKSFSEKYAKEYYITREIPKLKDFNEDLLSSIAYERNRIEVLSFEEETTSMTKREKIKYISNLFQEKYKERKINFNYPQIEEFDNLDKEAIINGTSKKNYIYQHHLEKNKSFQNRLNIGVEKDLIIFLNNCDYNRTTLEAKQFQNNIHKNTLQWHYFSKNVIIDSEVFRIFIDIRENIENETFFHKMRMEDITEEFLQNKKMVSPLPVKTDIKDGQLPFEYSNNITTEAEKNQQQNENNILNNEETAYKQEEVFSFSKDKEEELEL